MNPRAIPDPDVVMDDLADFLPQLRRALDAGLGQAALFFQGLGRSQDDPHLACHITRYIAAQRLGVALEESGGERDQLALSGMQFRIAPGGRTYILRVRRSRDGEMPPASTRALANFYMQLPLPLSTPETAQESDSEVPLNLVVLWSSSRGLASIDNSFVVVCPEAVDDRETVEYWRRTALLPEFDAPRETVVTTEVQVDDIPMEDIAAIRQNEE